MFYSTNSRMGEILKQIMESTPYEFKTYQFNNIKDSDIDISYTKDGAYLLFEVPGFNKTNLTVEVENGVLTIEGKRTFKFDGKEKEKTVSEKVNLTSECDSSSIEATVDDGLLTVFIPNYKKVAKKKINLM